MTSPINPPFQISGRQGRLPLSDSVLSVVGTSLFALILLPTLLYSGVNSATAIPLTLLTALVSQPLLKLACTPARGDVFLPTNIVAVYFLTYFVLRAFYLSKSSFLPRLGRNPYDDYLPGALWCASFGYGSLFIGFWSKAPLNWLHSLPKAAVLWPRSMPPFKIAAIMSVGLGCSLYLFKIGAVVGNYGNVEFQRHPVPGIIVLLENLIDLSWIAVCIFLATTKSKSSRSAVWLFLGFSIALIGFRLGISGGKTALIKPFLEAAIVYHYCKRRFRLWEIALIGLPVLMFAFGVVNFYRFVVVGSEGSPKNIGDIVSRVSSASSLLSSKKGVAEEPSALEQMVDRDAGVDALALVMKYTPHPFPYKFGSDWLQIPLTFIPRQIWKDKPLSVPAADFETTYMGEPSDFNGFSSIHVISDLYGNFSLPGILLGMFLIGAVLRFVYLFCSPSRENSLGVFLYTALFPELIHSFEGDVPYALIGLLRLALLAAGAAFFLGARYRRSRFSSPPRPLLSGGI